jgi:hypothetical protein
MSAPTPELKPAVEIIAEHLRLITRRWHELDEPCLIELVFLTAANVAEVKNVQRFEPTVEGIQQAAEHAAAMNFHRLNAYVTVNPVSATNRPKTGKRASRDHIVAAFFHWADGDDEDATARIQASGRPRPTFWVKTGTIPHGRPHLYWEREKPTRDLQAWSRKQRDIASTLGTDRTVVDPPRIMRLAGTINHPKPKKQAQGYVSELVTLHVPADRSPISSEDMARAFAAATLAGGPADGTTIIDTGPIVEGKTTDDYAELLRRARTDGEKHGGVRALTAALAGMGVNRACAEAIVREACPVWDAGVENLIESAYAKYYRADDDPFESEQEESAQAEAQADTAPERDVAPVDIWGKFAPPQLPRGLLPKVIEEFAFARGEQMGADPAGLATAALCVACAAIPDRIQVQVQPQEGWRESARIWVLLVGPPSTKKSPMLDAAERPLREIDAELFRDYLRRKAEYDALKKDEKAAAERPKHLRKRLDDTTIEAAAEIMADSPDGVLISQDELSGFLGSFDRYNGKGADRAFYLRSYNGGPFTVSRIGRGHVMVDNLSTCILGGIQPEPIRKAAASAADDGLIQRFLPIVLRGADPSRDDVQSAEAVRAYEALIKQLTKVELSRPISIGVRPRLVFEDRAHEVRRRLEHKHHEIIASVETFNRKLAHHVGKLDGVFARLCVAWHVIECSADGLVGPQVITEDVAQRVAAFMEQFLLPHAFAFYGGILDLSDDHDRLADVAGYILAHKLETMSVRDVARGSGSMRGLTRPEVLRLLEQLEALGWVAPQPTAARSNASPTWVVNPKVHSLYADLAAKEAERRRKAREHIQEVVRCRG